MRFRRAIFVGLICVAILALAAPAWAQSPAQNAYGQFSQFNHSSSTLPFTGIAVGAVAFAGTGTTLRFTATSRSAEVSASQGYPTPGSTIESAVITDSHPGGRFAAISDVRITGAIAGGVTLTAKGTNYTPAGLEF